MTEENIWKVLDAWREDRTRVRSALSIIDSGGEESWEWRRYESLKSLLHELRQMKFMWFIDGKEVV